MIQHLAIIPDGNRRWAAQHNLKSLSGHQRGIRAVQSVFETCFKHHIPCVTFYTFSLENFKRSEQEKEYLFAMLNKELLDQLPHLMEKNIKVSFIGDRTCFPADAKKVIALLEAETKHNTALRLNLLFCYGSQQELLNGIVNLAHQVKAEALQPEQITIQTIYQSLWTADLPPPDLIIRTGKTHRLSNFLLFQAAYSEITFLDCLWPDITEQQLSECVMQFNNTTRNFGT